MKKNISTFLFGSSFTQNKFANIALLLFRLHIGLSLAFGAGLPKMQAGLAPDWFVKQVGEIGFTFISPTFWATIASWGEFIGGICLAIGLLTRFSALQLAFQFFVIAFVWFDNPEPILGMYFQNTLFMSYFLVAFTGGGTYSFDYLIACKKIKIFNKKNALTIFLALSIFALNAQSKPLNGTGTVIKKTYNFTNFDKVDIKDVCGKIMINVGQPFSIESNVDSSLNQLLKIEMNDGVLKISFEGNRNNKLYVENCNTTFNINMPEASVIKHSSNAWLQIKGVVGRYIKIENNGNGGVNIEGTIDELDLKNTGNGSMDASKLKSKSLALTKRGNGSVIINSDTDFDITASGNGSIKNIGEGKAKANSSVTGNGSISYKLTNKSDTVQNSEKPSVKVTVKINNSTSKSKQLKVVYPTSGKYGISIAPNETTEFTFPIGTKLYKKGKTKELYIVIDKPNQYLIID